MGFFFRTFWIDYLRSFTVLLMLFHHAIHAYTTLICINPDNPVATSSPVADPDRWIGFDLMVVFNETFFMPLLFFISGLFVWSSLTKKGVKKYLFHRFTRLGLPYILGVFFLIPIAYYPAQLQANQITGGQIAFGEFWAGMIHSGFGTAGPLWFLWLLLVFNCLAAFLGWFSKTAENFIQKRLGVLFTSPITFAIVLIGLSMLAYVPLAMITGPLTWSGIGMFHVQIGRILLYLLYFLVGTGVGIFGIGHSVFASGSRFAKRWWTWITVGISSFFVFIFWVAVISENERSVVSETAFAICCTAFVLGFSGLFLSVFKTRVRIFDHLSRNAYGIYIFHYVWVTWSQYLVLKSPLSPGMKGAVVFFTTLMFSWAATALLRRIPMAEKII